MEERLSPATRGVGPLLQRDYWAVLHGSPSPAGLMQLVEAHFCDLPPRALVQFEAPAGLARGDRLNIHIAPSQSCRVEVIHTDEQSLTLATIEGHPEAGRITFGAYCNLSGEIIFHIRSRARSATLGQRLGFLAIGDAMQTNTWTDFIANTAVLAGARIRDVIHAETQQVDLAADDDEPLQEPTFLAQR